MPTTDASGSFAGGVIPRLLACLLVCVCAAAVARSNPSDQPETWASVRIAILPEAPEPHGRDGDEPADAAEAAEAKLDAARQAVQAVIKPHLEQDLAMLQPRQREALIKTIAGHVAARYLPEPDAALTLAGADEVHRWITPEDGREWSGRFSRWYEARHDSKPDDSVAMPDAMRAYIEETLAGSDSRIVGLAEESRGVRAWSARGRTPQHAHMALRQELSEDDVSFWMVGRGRPAMMFRTPKRTLEAVIGEQGPATLVRVHLLVQTEADEVVAMTSDWYWDARAGAWCVINFGRRGFEAEHGLECWF